MTNADLASIDERFNGLSAQITTLSGQMNEMKATMVTREEYNAAHGPLIKMVGRHEKIVSNAVRGLVWLGTATLVSAIVSPHWGAIMKGLAEFIK